MGIVVSRAWRGVSWTMAALAGVTGNSTAEQDTDTSMLYYVDNNYIFTPLVKSALKSLGWRHVSASIVTGVKQDSDTEKEFAQKMARYADLLWIRWRTTIPFTHLDDRHVVNHISNEHILTIKSKLCAMMANVTTHTGLVLHPETHLLSVLAAEKEAAHLLCQQPDVMWILKPAVGSSGRDIHIASSGAMLALEIEEAAVQAASSLISGSPLQEEFVVQRYIMNPLLLPGPTGQGHKFDMRIYFFIASSSPMMTFMYNDGYLRVNAEPYDLSDTSNLQAHITNFHVSKAHPQYDRLKDTVDGMAVRWTIAELGTHLEASTGDPGVMENVWQQIANILMHVSVQVQDQLDPRAGCFSLLGVDIMLDSNLKAWLIEFTKNPALRKNTPHLTTLHTGLVQEICDIALELRDLRMNQQPLTHELQSLQNFTLVHSEA